jgi:hypothetical protein
MHPGVIITSVVASLFGLAIVSVLVSQKSQTTGVIGATASGLAGLIQAATLQNVSTIGSLGSAGTTNSGGSYVTNPITLGGISLGTG